MTTNTLVDVEKASSSAIEEAIDLETATKEGAMFNTTCSLSSNSSNDEETKHQQDTSIATAAKEHHDLRRSKSFDLGGQQSASYMYSFHMHQQNTATDKNNDLEAMSDSACLPRRRCGPSASTSADNDYNFVLDNYVEYADNTRIPRLRGKNVGKLRAAIHSSHPLALCAVLTASCFLTYSISNYSPNLPADISQAVVVTIVLSTFPEVAASAGAGAYVGMVSRPVIPHYGWLTLLAFITSMLWTCFHKFQILVGCGGRLGTCAFLAMNITLIVFVMPSGAVSWQMYGSTQSLWADRLKLLPSILMVLASTLISAVAGFVRLRSKIPLNPVQAPTTIALLIMLILEPTSVPYAQEIDSGLAVGSFVAMASSTYLPFTLDFALAGFLAGLWGLFLDPFFLGFGGKKGFTSFCGFLSFIMILKIVRPSPATVKKEEEVDDDDEDPPKSIAESHSVASNKSLENV